MDPQTSKALNSVDTSTLHVAVVQPDFDDGIGVLISEALAGQGCEVINLRYEDRLPQTLDVVLVYGPYGSLVPMANQLLTCPPSERPLFVLWMTEQFPNPILPEWIRYPTSLFRSWIERAAFREKSPGEWRADPHLRWFTSKAYRFRYYGDLYWLQRQGILSILIDSSPWTVDFLRAKGFHSIQVSMGAHPDWGADLGLERDIPVLWIGKMGSRRRHRLLNRIRAELRERNIELMVVDGVEHPYVFGEERTVLLNRTKIVLNLLREKWDNNSMRYCLAAPNRALVVTEPTLPHSRFLPGVHLIEAPLEQMTATICHYLSHEEERQRIVDQAYQLVTKEFTMREGMARILEQVILLRQNTMFTKV